MILFEVFASLFNLNTNFVLLSFTVIMDPDISSNPFAALFPSLDRAKEYQQAIHMVENGKDGVTFYNSF